MRRWRTGQPSEERRGRGTAAHRENDRGRQAREPERCVRGRAVLHASDREHPLRASA